MAPHRLKYAEQLEILRSVVRDACVGVLAAAGAAAREIDRPEPPATSDHDIAGFIGFTGSVRGSLVVTAAAEVFRDTYPVLTRESEASQDDLFDWAGEMANQILGGVKRRFCDRGRDIETSTPTAIAGRDLGWRAAARTRDVELVFAVAGGVLTIHFEIIAPNDGEIFPDPAVPIGCSREGDVVLF
jgi:CheY-specific phosphatase CheX